MRFAIIWTPVPPFSQGGGESKFWLPPPEGGEIKHNLSGLLLFAPRSNGKDDEKRKHRAYKRGSDAIHGASLLFSFLK